MIAKVGGLPGSLEFRHLPSDFRQKQTPQTATHTDGNHLPGMEYSLIWNLMSAQNFGGQKIFQPSQIHIVNEGVKFLASQNLEDMGLAYAEYVASLGEARCT